MAEKHGSMEQEQGEATRGRDFLGKWKSCSGRPGRTTASGEGRRQHGDIAEGAAFASRLMEIRQNLEELMEVSLTVRRRKVDTKREKR